MYHDVIHINFKNSYNPGSVDFDYNFLISKNSKEKFSPIKYSELLQKFDDFGFELKYLKFYDINDDAIVFCTYNYQPNFEIFFSAYKKVINDKLFLITFEYGNVINGKFYPNNMNFFAGVFFIPVSPLYEQTGKDKLYKEVIIKGKIHYKKNELYQIVDKNGDVIYCELTGVKKDFEQHFFEQYEVKVALRKYKLNRLKASFNEDENI
jgi:hypothetical protein